MKTPFHSMTRILNRAFVLAAVFVAAFSNTSCNRVAKSSSKHIFSRIVKATEKGMAESAGEKTVRVYGKEALKELPWDEVILLLEKENPLVGGGIKKLSKHFKKGVADRIKIDPRLFRALTFSETLLDDYKSYVGNSRKLMDNEDMFLWYALACYSEPADNSLSFIKRTTIREEDDIIKILDKSSGKTLSEINGNIINVLELAGGEHAFPENTILRSELLPNSVYKARGKNGLEYLFNVDDVGRVASVKARKISPDDISINILGRNSDIDLGNEGASAFKHMKEVSGGQDIDLLVTYKYAGDSRTPSFVNIEGEISGHNRFNHTFQNIEASSVKLHSLADNRRIVDRFAKKFGLDDKKKEDLLRELSENESLAELIHNDPEFNIQRWLNTRNHVNKEKVAKQANGQYVLNGRTYAGNSFYFDPALNNGLSSKVQSSGKYDYYTLEQLLELDKKYPNGVRYTERGFPDFIGAGACKTQDGKPIVFEFPGGLFTGDDGQDIAIATNYMKEKYGDAFDMFGYTWHHLEEPPARLILVDYDVHRICKHTGGNSLLN